MRIIKTEKGHAVAEIQIGNAKFYVPVYQNDRDATMQKAVGDLDMNGRSIRNVGNLKCKELRTSENSIHVGNVVVSYDETTKRLKLLDSDGTFYYIGTINSLEDDISPKLSGNLDANNKSIQNVLNIDADVASIDDLAVSTHNIIPKYLMPINYLTGMYYTNAITASSPSTFACSANYLYLTPFMVYSDIAIDRLGFVVRTSAAGVNGKLCIYDSDSNNLPTTIIDYSGDLSCATGSVYIREKTVAINLKRNKIYWAGYVISGASVVTNSIPLASSSIICYQASNATPSCFLRRAMTYSNAFPSPFNFTNADILNSSTNLEIRFRKA